MERKNNMEEIFGKINDVTFQTYLGCRSVVGINEIEILTEIFERLKKEHLTFGKVLHDDNVIFAVKFKPTEKGKSAILKSENNFENSDESRERKFFESAKVLATVLPLLNDGDRFGLNRLFSSIIQLGRSIGEKQITEDGYEYYPIKYYSLSKNK